ncbi:TPA: ABC-three component system middle component 4 [Bacillus paranthracis]|uniref:ABC-three component system middle component 4 n=1 Tax=Bacillus cereus group TaxID=86661 RepID=UPI0018AD43C4|nr:ABC-three component system middle component 4 [Bacillus paranthracis]QPI80797.1 hypothetical protein I0K14_21375 [Bacillus paranthracis]
MIKVPFVVSEFDINIRLARVLIIINHLSTLRSGREVLNLEKIVIFDFLLQYPKILYHVLEEEGINNPFDLEDYDTESIETIAPTKLILFERDRIKEITKLLYSKKMIDVSVNDDIYFTSTDNGKQFVEQMKSSYLRRLIKLTFSMTKLKSLSISKLKMKVVPFIQGDN